MDNNKKQQLNTYLGAIHIHSNYSDGTGNIDSISKAAKKAGLSWIIITDHNNFDIEEGFYNDVCVIKGEEISPDNANHYIALGIKSYIPPASNITKTIEEVHKQNGFGFAAHPDESDFRKNSFPPIKWLDKNIIPDGVEIWNWFSAWGDKFNDRNIFNIIYSYLFKHKLVREPARKTLEWWDLLNKNSNEIVPAISGVDAHALKIQKYLIPVTVFPYKTLFKTVTNVLFLTTPLSNNFATAKEQILRALKDGRNMIINKKNCKNIPVINIENRDEAVTCGETIKIDNQTYINIELPRTASIKILCDGLELYNLIAKTYKQLLNQTGKYRVEINVNGKGLAYTNPILVY